MIGTTSEHKGWKTDICSNSDVQLIIGEEPLGVDPNRLADVIKSVLQDKWPNYSGEVLKNKKYMRCHQSFSAIFCDSGEK